MVLEKRAIIPSCTLYPEAFQLLNHYYFEFVYMGVNLVYINYENNFYDTSKMGILKL